MHQMLIFCVSVNVRNFDLVQCIHENYNNMKQTQDQILKGGHVNICAEGDGLSDPFLKYTFCWLTCLESCSSEVMFISRSWALDHKNHTEWQLTGGWENGPGQSQRVNVHSEIVEVFFLIRTHQNDVNKGDETLTNTLTVMSSRYHLILNRGNIILVMYVISHPVLNCRVEWNLVKLCAHPLKYGWALSSFQVHFTFHSYEYWQMKSVSLLFVVIHLLAGVIGSVCYEVITSLHLL